MAKIYIYIILLIILKILYYNYLEILQFMIIVFHFQEKIVCLKKNSFS